jgi:GNAT superfamily N-acetyltransferase
MTNDSYRVHTAAMGLIRLAHHKDLPLLREVERAAGESFRDLGMGAVANNEPLSVKELSIYQRAGHAWVTVDETGRVAGYVLVDVVDGAGYVEQLSVHPDHSRRGLGRALLETVAEWADSQGLSALTLTTFAEVPWNAPYYARLGFRVLTPAELSPGLRRRRAAEQARGLDAWPRVAMLRSLRWPTRAR